MQQVEMLRNFGLVDVVGERCTPSSEAVRWMETGRSEIVIGTIHANIRFIGELLHRLQQPQSFEQMRLVANDAFGFAWQTVNQVTYRLNWLRSGGLAEKLPDGKYRTTEAGLVFLTLVELHRPTTVAVPPPDGSRPEPVTETAQDDAGATGQFDANVGRGEEPSAPGTKVPRTAQDLASEIGERLVSLSCDGSKHQEFEVAVRDAFAFLGFSAERLSGPGQTDVLLTGFQHPEARGADDSTSWSYRVAVDAKASTNGKLADLQVTWPALALHREKHAATFSMLVGPSPRPRLLQFADGASVTVLSADQLATLCREHAEVPLTVADYFWLFADSDGGPRGGAADLSFIAAARVQATTRRDLLAQVAETVNGIAADFGPANQQLVRFSLTTKTALGGDALSAEVAAALDFLGSSWLRTLVRADSGVVDPHYVPTAPSRTVAARLRWLADAFDEAADDASESSEAS